MPPNNRSRSQNEGRRPLRPNGPASIPLPNQTVQLIRDVRSRLVHPDLLLHKFVRWYQGWKTKGRRNDPTIKDAAFQEVFNCLQKDHWKDFAERLSKRRRFWLRSLSGRARLLQLTTQSNLAVNLSSAGPLDLGIAFDHLYGLPVIPGSALKGIAHRWAELQKPESLALFGTKDHAGEVAFLDAICLTVPSIERDIMTPHHPQWYEEKAGALPNDRENPRPIPFLSVKAGATFETALITATFCKDPEKALDAAENCLRAGLAELGAGAKTAAGYGVMEVTRIPPDEITAPEVVEPPPVPAESPAQRLLRQIQHLSGPRAFGALVQKIPEVLQLEGKDREIVAREFIERMGGLRDLRRRARKKPVLAELLEAAGYDPG